MFCRLHHALRTTRFAVQSNRADRALDGVTVHLDGAILKEQFEAVHVFGDVTELLAKA